jgi:hypothetical protein
LIVDFYQRETPVKMGSFETFAASRPNVGNGVKGRLCADVLVIPIM